MSQPNPIKVDEGYFESCCRRFYFYGTHSFKCTQANKVYMEDLEHKAKIIMNHENEPRLPTPTDR